MAQREGQSIEPDAELLDEMRRLLDEAVNSSKLPKPPIREQITRLRAEIAEGEREEERLQHLGQMDDYTRVGMDRNQLKRWLLAQAEAELVRTQDNKP